MKNASTGQAVTLPGTSWQKLRPGQNLRQDVRLATVKLRIRILQADGITPVTKRVFFVSDERSGVTLSAATNEEGVLVLDPVPTGRFEVTTWQENPHQGGVTVPSHESESVRVMLGSILVQSGREPSSFELRMPRRAK